MRKRNLIISCALFLVIFLGNGTVYAQERYTNDGYICAMTEGYLDELLSYLAVGDKTAADQMMKQGKTFMLKGGVKVYIMEYPSGSGKVKIRPAGNTGTCWTVTGALK
jgi:hypothetical protein